MILHLPKNVKIHHIKYVCAGMIQQIIGTDIEGSSGGTFTLYYLSISLVIKLAPSFITQEVLFACSEAA
jgi:hypothetical protein